MVNVVFTKEFRELFSRLKEKSTKERIIKQIEKIKTDPELGKPMRGARKGTRELYIGSFRLSYEYFKDRSFVYMLDFYHKDEQ